MTSPHRATARLAASFEHGASPRRARARVVALGLVVALSIGLVACGDGGGGQVVIDLSGGAGNDALASGSSAGLLGISIATDDGTGNTILVSGSGKADTGFTPTTGLVPVLGMNPLIISQDTVVPLDPSEEPAAGEPYMLSGEYSLFVSNGDMNAGQTDDRVSGLQVDAGALLTLPLNFNFSAELHFSDDVANAGEITVTDVVGDPTRRGALFIQTFGDYIGRGSISTYATADGQTGGNVEILAAEGNVYNFGDVNAAGGDATTGMGGGGGSINFNAAGPVPGGWLENTGDLTTSAGAATGSEADGGIGGGVYLFAKTGLRNSGDVDTRGGDGTFNGGAGGEVWIDNGSPEVVSSLYNDGDITTSGGDGAAGSGGAAGPIQMLANGGELRTSGQLTSEGGAAPGPDGSGGFGGAILLESKDEGVMAGAALGSGVSAVIAAPVAGDVTVSGTIRTLGGHGGFVGGGGGYLLVGVVNNAVSARSIQLLGYDRIEGQGASSVSSGGNGTTASFKVASSLSAAPMLGTVTVEPPIDFRGGDSDAFGGAGGDVLVDQDEITLGTTNLSGGAGTNPGPDGEVVTGYNFDL